MYDKMVVFALCKIPVTIYSFKLQEVAYGTLTFKSLE